MDDTCQLALNTYTVVDIYIYIYIYILVSPLFFKGGVLIYAEHCINILTMIFVIPHFPTVENIKFLHRIITFGTFVLKLQNIFA